MDTKLNQDRLHVASMNLIEMRENRILTDLILNCKGGMIHAHKCVLMATNTFFYNLFVNTQLCDNSFTIDFDNVTVEAMAIMISTLYGDAPHKFQNAEQIMKVLGAAHAVKDRVMITYCMTFFLTQLTLDNCIDLWYLSAQYEQTRAENCAKAYIIEHLPELLKADKLSNMSIDAIKHFVCCASELMCVGDELLLLVVEWAKKNRLESNGKVPVILNSLDKLVFSVDCIVDLLNNDSFVRSSPELTAYLTSAKAISHTIPIKPVCNDPFNSSLRNGTIPIDCATLTTTCTCSSRSPHESKTNLSIRTTTSTVCNKLNKSDLITHALNRLKNAGRNSLKSSTTNNNSTLSTKFGSTLSVTSFDPVLSYDIQHKINLQIHFYCQTDTTKIGDLVCQTYLLTDKLWSTERCIHLSKNVKSNWYPLSANDGQQFYFAISPNKTFLAFEEKSSRTYIGPPATFQNRVAAVSDGCYIYVWSYESIAQFNTKSCTWKMLSPNRNVAAGWSNLLVTNGKLFFHAAFPSVIYKYNFENNDWQFEKSFNETYNVKSIRCKCVCSECKGKLYFIVNDMLLYCYDTKTDEWIEKNLPDFMWRVPLFMNCDEMFILFIDKRFKTNFFLYYPEIDRLELIENADIPAFGNIITSDISLKNS